MSLDSYVSMDRWSKDHWSTLGYIETVMTDCGGFQVGSDARMRSNRRHFRVMAEECPNPKRMGRGALGISMSPDHGTRLKDGTVIPGHDDWMCVQDMAAEGLFTVGPDQIEPGITLHLSEKGKRIADGLRAHKASGSNFASYVPVLP